jgi:hypothetical protein
MKPKVSDEIKAKLLARVYTDLMPDPPPKPKPKVKAEVVEAEVLPFPPILSEQELHRRQALIDQAWERTLAAKRDLEAEAARSCHRGPSDPDWEIAAFDPVWGKRK